MLRLEGNGNEISKRALIQTCAPFELALRRFDIIRYDHILQLWDYYDNDHNGYLDLMELKVISLVGLIPLHSTYVHR